MHIKRFVVTAILLVLNIGIAWGQKDKRPSYREYYDLNFKKFSKPGSWTGGNTMTPQMFIHNPQDSVRKIYPFFAWEFPTQFHIWRSIRLPRIPNKELSAIAKVQFPTADSVALVAYRVNDKGGITTNRNVWRKESSSEGIKSIALQLQNTSTPDLQLHLIAYLPNLPSPKPGGGLFSSPVGTLIEVDLQIDGNSILEQEVPSIDDCTLEKEYPITTLGSNGAWDFSKIKALGRHRIIGLGETMHFNPDIEEMVHSLGLHLAHKYKADLILREILLSESLIYNRYINDKHYNLPLVYKKMMYQYNVEMLKKEAQQSNKRLYYFGIDIDSSSETLGVGLSYFLFTLPKWEDNMAICQLIDILASPEDIPKALPFVKEHRSELGKLLWTEELDIIEHHLRINSQLPPSGFERAYMRDQFMAANTRFLVERFSPEKNKPVIVYAHLAHLATYPLMMSHATVPLGSYLRDWLGPQFYRVSIHTTGGETRQDMGVYGGWEGSPVAKMTEGTLENALSMQSDSPFFMAIPQSWGKLQRGRLTGVYPSNSPLPRAYNLQQNADALIYLPGRSLTEDEKQNTPGREEHARILIEFHKYYLNNLKLAKERTKVKP